jgi:hypothetical protein
MLLVLCAALAHPAWAIPISYEMRNTADETVSVSASSANPSEGSFTAAHNLWPRVELKRYELLSMTRHETDMGSDTGFPYNARDLQDWLGTAGAGWPAID